MWNMQSSKGLYTYLKLDLHPKLSADQFYLQACLQYASEYIVELAQIIRVYGWLLLAKTTLDTTLSNEIAMYSNACSCFYVLI